MNSKQTKKVRRKKIRVKKGYNPNLNQNKNNNYQVPIQHTLNQKPPRMDRDKNLEEKKVERIANSVEFKQYYTFKDIINLNLNEYQIRKVFHNGEMVYQITDKSVIIKIKSGKWYGNSKRTNESQDIKNSFESNVINDSLRKTEINNYDKSELNEQEQDRKSVV